MAFHRALIVDDSKLARVTLKKKLESHGLVVELVDSAQQAYSTLPAIQPDIIFMDHLMPGIDGFEATQHIRQMAGFQRVPIVMCTGKEQDGYLEEALAIGANYILSKPPVDEALNALLASSTFIELAEVSPTENQEFDIPSGDTVVETDIADFMAEYKESVMEAQTEKQDLSPMPETDIADFMVEKSAGVVVGQNDQNLQLSAEVIQAGINREDVERICAQMIDDALAQIPLPKPEAVIEIPVLQQAPVDMELILSSVNTSVQDQLSQTAMTLKAEFQAMLESQIADKISQTMDQDIQGILDLRLNVMLMQKFAETNAKIDNMEKQLNEKVAVLNNSADMLSVDSPLTLEQPGGLSARMEQLYDEQIQLMHKVKIFQMVTGASILLAVTAIIVAFIQLK